MARRRGGPLSPSRYIRRTSINRGLLGDDRLWRTVFMVIMGRRVLRKVLGSGPQVVAIEKLKPGQFLRVEAIDPSTVEGSRRRRRS